MSEPDFLDNNDKFNQPPVEGSGLDVVEDKLSGKPGQQSVGSNTDVQETSQSSNKSILKVGVTTDIEESTRITTDILIQDEEEAREIVDFVSWLIAEQKAESSLSSLDTAILLFRQVLENYLPTHPLYPNSLRDLSSALCIRFMQTNEINDMMECGELRVKMIDTYDSNGNIENLAATQEGEDETEATRQLANELLTDFRHSTSLAVLNTVIVLAQQALPHLLFAHATRMAALTTLIEGLYARQYHLADNMASDLDEGLSMLEDAIRCCTNERQKRQLGLQMAVLLIGRFDATGNVSDCHSAIASLRAHRDHENSVLRTLISATELSKQFLETRNMNHLNRAIGIFQAGMENLHAAENRINCANNLAVALSFRFKQEGTQSDLDEAISLYRQALELLPQSHLNRAGYLNNLSEALMTRFEQKGQHNDLDEAISLCRQALELRQSSHPNQDNSLNDLAHKLKIRFDQRGQYSDRDEVISLYKRALELQPAPHRGRANTLNNLGIMLTIRFDQGGEDGDLDAAVVMHKEALELRPPPDPDRAYPLDNLANSLVTRFEQRGQRNDIDDAISLYRQALQARLSSHPHRSSILHNIANALLTRFNQGGQHGDLDEAISCLRQAFEMPPSLHANQSMSCTILANALVTRFDQRGQHTDLDEAITLHRQALELRPLPHRHRSDSLNNLAGALNIRFEQGGQHSDINEAISLLREALEMLPPLHRRRFGSLNNLASALKNRFDQGGLQSDLDEAISLYRQALELLSLHHPDRYISLHNMANVLKIRFEQLNQHNDLDEAISLNRQVLELLPPLHAYRTGSIHNLATALNARFDQRAQKDDLEEAISLFRQVLDNESSSYANQSLFLQNLAVALNIRYEQEGQQGDLDEAMSLLSTATQHRFQPPSLCLDISRKWIDIAAEHRHDSLIAAYRAALQILPQVAALTLPVELRQKALIARSDGLARDASRCAISLGDVPLAVEFLEAGRSVFWSQVLSLRSPFDRLHTIVPDGALLAQRLQSIAQELENGSHRDISAHNLDNKARLAVDQESSRLNQLGKEWEEIILRVRRLPGFEDFLLPPRLSSLQLAASIHPVILLIANADESHCLVMTSTVTHHIPLRSLRAPILKLLVENVRMASSTSMSRSLIEETRHTVTQELGEERGISYQNDSEDSDGIFRFVLKMIWDEIVKPIIDFLDIKKQSDELSILQWCPTGHFTFLPIHAAGIYDANNSTTECAADYFISSYTPTIGILLAEPSSAPSQTFKMMTIIQSQELPSTTLELGKIRSHVPEEALIAMGVPGSPACVETVASQLSDISIVHFACHGYQEPSEPLDSGLKLHDGRLRISRIMKEKMPNGALAFLSACETAMGDENLPDEAMSLAASLLFSGFRRVVATMWMMMDEDGPTIADTFYRELFRGPEGEKTSVPDVTKSAYALHVAVQELRFRKVSLRRWVPFIHMGQC